MGVRRDRSLDSRRYVLRGVRANFYGALPQVFGVEKFLDRQVCELGVCDPPIPIGESELLELDERVQVVGCVVPHRGQIMLRGHLHEGDLGDALRVWRQHQNAVIEVVALEG